MILSKISFIARPAGESAKGLLKICLAFLFPVLLNPGNVSGQISGKPPVNDTTYMLTYDHGGLILWGSEHFRERLGNALEWLDKYPGFKIGLDNEAQIYDHFAEYEPEMLNELKDVLQKYKGRFAIGSATYGQPLSQFISDESNIRQISYALRAERKYFNCRPPVYLMSEHAMHSQIPQIIKSFGFEGAIMRTHFMMYGYNPVFDLPIGWWVGIDKSRIPAIPTYPGEGASFGKTTMDTWILTRYPGADSKEPIETFRKKFEHINPLLASRADDSGLRKEEMVKENEGKAKFRWILLEDLMGKFPAPSADMFTGPNDFTVRMPWGYCGNKIWNESRKAEVSILTAERLAALESLNGGSSHENDLDKSWKDLLLAQHHDIQICGLLSESEKLLPSSISLSEQIIRSSMSFFSENMAGEGLLKVTAFNPLSWEQTRWITARINLNRGDARFLAAKCGENLIPVNIIESNKLSDGSILSATISFRAKLPPLSLVSFSILPSEKPVENTPPKIVTDEKNQRIITPFYEVRLSMEGGMAYLKDARTGEYISDPGKRTAFFEGTIDGSVCQSHGRWVIKRPTGTEPWAKVVEHGFISDIPYEFEVVFYEDDPGIDCRVKFEFNGQKIGLLSDDTRDSHSPFVHEEKLRFKFFPGSDTASTGVRDLPFAIAETSDRYVEGNFWTALATEKAGIAYFNKGTMGSIREKDGSFSIPLSYSMYYIWGTRMLYGSYDYEFGILPFSGSWHDADLHRRALEYSFNIPTIASTPSAGKSGYFLKAFPFFADDDVILTAMYPENGNVTVRFFKSGDRSNLSSVRIENPATETELDGRKIRDTNGKIDFKPWQIRTFQIRQRL